MPHSAYNWGKIEVDISKVHNNKTFCPKCHTQRKNKRDRSLYVNLQTGVYKCFYSSCDFRGCVADKPQYQKTRIYEAPPPRLQKVSDHVVQWFEQRGISNNTLLRMKITESTESFAGEKKKAICYNYYRDEKLINIKFRSRDKQFKMSANAELIPYNIDATKDETEIIWVEGENDCLALIEAGIFNVVSVPNGAAGDNPKLEYIDNCYQEIEHIEKHIIAVDGDEAGKKLKDALSFRFGIEKCWFIEYPENCKDFNEVLLEFGKDKIKEILAAAKQNPLKGVYFASDLAEDIFDVFANGRKIGETTHYQSLDNIFRWKRKDINLIIGHANYGKTQMWLHLMLVKSMYDNWRWAIFCPENYPATDFYIDVIEMYVGKHIDNRMDNKMGVDELYEAIEFFNEHFIYVYPDEAHDLQSILTIFRGLILRHGIDGFLIDPWNQLDHIIDNREDLYLSKALKEIKRFALLNDVSFNIIAHPKTLTPNKGEDQLPEVRPWHIAGGVMWLNKSDFVISVERPYFYSQPTSGFTKVKTHKVKRKRTGGMIGDVEFDYILKESRYIEQGSKIMVCHPNRAAKFKQENVKQLSIIEDIEVPPKLSDREQFLKDLDDPNYIPF